MPALIPISVTDTFDQWRQKDNAIATAVNNLSPGTNVFLLQPPINNQDILTWSTTLGMFTNTTITALVNEIITQLGTQNQSQLKPFYWASLRNLF
jgi:hypothetical protein